MSDETRTTAMASEGGRRASAVEETANDRFKRSFGDWFWGSVVAATLVHFGIFFFWPSMSAADTNWTPDELEGVEIPPEVEIPPPPEQIARPAVPVVAEATVDEDITIAETTFEDNPIDELPPPPSEGQTEGRFQQFMPSMVKPELRNKQEVSRALERHYPPLLRDAGIGGTVGVWFWIDENGRVVRTKIAQSSGHGTMDGAALAVADIMQFSPALNRDQRVAVVVAMPIVFQTR